MAVDVFWLRLVQYCSKFAWWYLTRANVADDLVDKLKKLSSSLSTARKCEW